MAQTIVSQQRVEAIGTTLQIVALVNAVRPVQQLGAAAPRLIHAMLEEVTVIQIPSVQEI